jgi:hypothetical protein
MHTYLSFSSRQCSPGVHNSPCTPQHPASHTAAHVAGVTLPGEQQLLQPASWPKWQPHSHCQALHTHQCEGHPHPWQLAGRDSAALRAVHWRIGAVRSCFSVGDAVQGTGDVDSVGQRSWCELPAGAEQWSRLQCSVHGPQFAVGGTFNCYRAQMPSSSPNYVHFVASLSNLRSNDLRDRHVM